MIKPLINYVYLNYVNLINYVYLNYVNLINYVKYKPNKSLFQRQF